MSILKITKISSMLAMLAFVIFGFYNALSITLSDMDGLNKVTVISQAYAESTTESEMALKKPEFNWEAEVRVVDDKSRTISSTINEGNAYEVVRLIIEDKNSGVLLGQRVIPIDCMTNKESIHYFLSEELKGYKTMILCK